MSPALSLARVRPTPPEVAELDGAVHAGIEDTLTMRPGRDCVTDAADGRRDDRFGPSTDSPGGRHRVSGRSGEMTAFGRVREFRMLRFNGTWKLDLANASKWDTATKSYIPDAVGEEIITIRVEDSVQTYEVLYGDDPVIRMGYTARFDAAEWVPYSVREIITAPGVDQTSAVAAFRQRIGANEASNARNFQVGKPYGLVRLVYVDEQTHYRIGKSEDGRPQNVLLRRLAEDGSSYMTSLLDAEGVVSRIRPFIRVG